MELQGMIQIRILGTLLLHTDFSRFMCELDNYLFEVVSIFSF